MNLFILGKCEGLVESLVNADPSLCLVTNEEEAQYLIYNVTSDNLSPFLLARVVESSIKMPGKVIMNVVVTGPIDKLLLNSLVQVGKLVAGYGNLFCSGVTSVQKALIALLGRGV